MENHVTESIHDDLYLVVCNDRGQYSIWPAEKTVPDGWSPVGGAESKAQCLARIEKLWPDPTGADL